MHLMVCGLRGFPDVQGGVETHAQHLYSLLVKKGCKVTVLSRSRFQPEGIETWNGVNFVNLWCPKATAFEAIVHTFLAVLYAAIKRPDALHIHAVGPALMAPLARVLGIKVVMTHHGPDYDREKWGKAAKFVLRLGERLGVLCSNKTIVISQVISEQVASKFGVSTIEIPNGVELPSLDFGTDTPEQFGLEPGKYILLVSRIVPEKRHKDLIEAFRKADIAGWKLALVGEDDHHGPYEQEVHEMAKECSDIVCTGTLRGEALQEMLCHAGLFVLPSSHEGLPIALLEAMSFGLPCLASDIPANLAVQLGEKNYFELGNIDMLTARLLDCVDTPQTMERKQQIRNVVIEKYDWSRIADSTFSVFESVSKH